MKPEQLARLLNVNPSTLRKWAGKEFAMFLSPTAQGINGARRAFSDQDARILSWVALLRSQNMSIDEIAQMLQVAQTEGWKNLPPLSGGMTNEPIAVIPREAVEERVYGLQQRYETELKIVVAERDQLKVQLEVAQRELVQANQDHITTIRELQDRIVTLTGQEAELRGKLAQYSFGGLHWNAVMLVLFGATLMGLILIVVYLLTLVKGHF